MPSGAISIELEADTREDLDAAIARLKAAGLMIEWDVPQPGPGRPAALLARVTHAVGTLQLYDTPETAAAKARAAGNAVRQIIRQAEHP